MYSARPPRRRNAVLASILRGSFYKGQERLTVSGKDLLLPNGQKAVLRGISQGTWGTNYEVDAAAIKACGANTVRYVFRWWGDYGVAGTDSRSPNIEDDYIDPGNLAQFLQELRWLEDQGLWIIVAFDSNCGQNGLQNQQMIDYCDPNGDYPDTGHNFWSDLQVRGFFKTAWQRIARELLDFNRIAMFELMPEPLADRDATWADDVKEFYQDVMGAIRQVDTRTPFLVGARDAYNMALVEEVYMSDRTDVIYTGNLLNPKVIQQTNLHGTVQSLVTLRETHNVPILVQQVGRRTADDPTLTGMRGVLSLLNSLGIHWTWWQYHQNTTQVSEYALYYKDGFGGWTPKPDEIAAFTYYCQQTYSQLEQDAIDACTAAGAILVYIKDNLSNTFKDTAGSVLCTAVNDDIARVSAVVGARFLQQSTSGFRPKLQNTINGYSWDLDGVDDFLTFDNVYFATGDDTYVITAGQCPNLSTTRLLYQCGSPSSTPRYPMLGINSSDLPIASWRDDTGAALDCVGTTDGNNRPMVLRAVKIGSAKSLYFNGLQEGATENTAVGTTTLTRTRAGAGTQNASYWQGKQVGVCIAKAPMTDAQMWAVERFFAYKIGAPCRV